MRSIMYECTYLYILLEYEKISKSKPFMNGNYKKPCAKHDGIKKYIK